MRLRRRFVMLAAAALLPLVAVAQQASQTVRLAFIDPLSGPAAEIGRNSLKSWQFMAERKSGAGNPAGVNFVVAGFDNKGSPRETLNALKSAIDQGFRYIVQGNGSGAAAVIADAVARHNLRHPERAVLYINYAAMDPALTGERCSFWHFRVEADTAMKMRAMGAWLATQPQIKKVYLLNQNYAHGQQFALYFRQAVAATRPDLMIVGDELHPAFSLSDFTPHVKRIQASGAQAVVSGNWGVDMEHLVEALQQQDLRLPLLTYYAGLKGMPELLARSGERLPVLQFAQHHHQMRDEPARLAAEFRAAEQEDLVVFAAHDGLVMLGEAMARARSTTPLAVARALGGLRFNGFNGPVQMRAEDHQLQTGLYVSRWQKLAAGKGVSAEGTGHGFVPLMHLDAAQLGLPSRCHMPTP